MAKKTNDFYFDNFKKCTEVACSAAEMLNNIITDFHSNPTEDQLYELHKIEHQGDSLKHQMMEALVKAFITPIEREDIIKLSDNIDSVIDAIEDIVLQIHIAGLTTLRPECEEFSQLIIKSCNKMLVLMTEFENFKKSKNIKEIIIEINNLEEEGDKLYLSAMKNLHATSKDAFEVLIWREIYKYFEKVCDTIEHVSELVESIIIENM